MGLIWRYSGGATNTDPDLSLGGAMSLVDGGVVQLDVQAAVLSDVAAEEAATGSVRHAAFYVVNTGPGALNGVGLYIVDDTSSLETSLALGPAVEGVDVPIAETLLDPSDAPAGVVFSQPTKLAPLPLGDLAAGSFRGFWLRRTLGADAAAFADVARLRVAGFPA